MERVTDMLGRLDALRTELAELAYGLERRGRLDAADLAVAVSARVGEIHDELAAGAVAKAVRRLPWARGRPRPPGTSEGSHLRTGPSALPVTGPRDSVCRRLARG